MLLVKWFPYTILLLALIGSSFSLKCKICVEGKDKKEPNCEKSQDCPDGSDSCIKSMYVGEPKSVNKDCFNSKIIKSCKYFPTIGSCVTAKVSEIEMGCKGRNGRAFKDENKEVETCLCSGDDCNSAFGPVPNLGLFVFGIAAIIAVSWIGGYGAFGI